MNPSGSQGVNYGFFEESEPHVRMYNNLVWLTNRCREVQTAIEYEQAKDKPEMQTQEYIQMIDSVLQEAQDKLYDNMLSDITFPRLQLADILYQATFSQMGVLGSESEELKEKIDDKLHDYVHNLLIQDLKISSKISKEHEEVQSIRDEVKKLMIELSEISSERAEEVEKTIRHEERKRAQEAKQAEEAKANSELIKKVVHKTEKVEKMLGIINLTMQLLIFHSGVNWAKDPELLELIVDCGKPLDEQLAEEDDDVSDSL